MLIADHIASWTGKSAFPTHRVVKQGDWVLALVFIDSMRTLVVLRRGKGGD
jgi:hypothetical protein